MRKNILQPANTICVAEQIKKYLCDNIYMLCLALTAIGSYGFFISHFSVSVDDLKYHYTITEGCSRRDVIPAA